MKKKIARIISEILNGFATMLLPVVIATILSDIAPLDKLLIGIYYIFACILPFFVLKSLGRVSDYEFTDRKERPPYFIIQSTLFIIGYIIIRNTGSEELINIAYVQAIITVIFTIVTFFWKISGHMTYGVFFLMTMIYLFPEVRNLYLILLFIPPLAWSRVALEKHTYLQTVAGTILSLTTSLLIYQLL
jgi:membrane-associated phospholipid phosphatase